MKQELTKQFVKKTIRKIVIFAFLMIVITAITQSMSPIVSNNLALTQMQNSDETFVLMDTYNKIRPIFSLVYSVIIVWFVYGIGRDTYKFVKALGNNNNDINKEN